MDEKEYKPGKERYCRKGNQRRYKCPSCKVSRLVLLDWTCYEGGERWFTCNHCKSEFKAVEK